MDKLLKLLSENSGFTTAEIAAMLGEPEDYIKAQIKEYENSGVIKGYQAVVNWDMVDDSYVEALIELQVTPKKETGFDEMAGIIVTFWGSDKVTEHSRQKEVRAAMQLVAEELEYNRKELRNIKHLLDIDRNMSSLLIEHKMDISGIPADTLSKYDKLFNNMSELSYKTDALDVLKGSSLMQYISDKRLLQDVLQTYFELGRRKKDVSDYYAAKTDVIMKLAMSRNFKFALKTNNNLLNQISFLISNDQFVNFVIMVPGFLYWEEFDELDEMLDKQIQTLKAKYK